MAAKTTAIPSPVVESQAKWQRLLATRQGLHVFFLMSHEVPGM